MVASMRRVEPAAAMILLTWANIMRKGATVSCQTGLLSSAWFLTAALVLSTNSLRCQRHDVKARRNQMRRHRDSESPKACNKTSLTTSHNKPSLGTTNFSWVQLNGSTNLFDIYISRTTFPFWQSALAYMRYCTVATEAAVRIICNEIVQGLEASPKRGWTSFLDTLGGREVE
jgi:hypothetical protein